MIRLATDLDLPLLPAIEIAAGAPFRGLGMTAVADDAPPTVAELEPYLRGGRLWVATAPPPAPRSPTGSPHRHERKRSVDQIEQTVHSPAPSAAERPVGYALADVVDGTAHLAQVSVDPRWSGRRLGAALIEEVAGWARRRGDRLLTLTTFAEVPWNAPYYRRLGFAPIPDAGIGPELRAVRDRERANGLDAWPRIEMRLALPRTQ